jgi:hypothetical protein
MPFFALVHCKSASDVTRCAAVADASDVMRCVAVDEAEKCEFGLASAGLTAKVEIEASGRDRKQLWPLGT